MPDIDEEGVTSVINWREPTKYIVAYNVNWWVAPGHDGKPELWVTNVGSWGHAMIAKDVENWEGTPWEDCESGPTTEMINQRRDTLISVFESLK